MRTNQLTRLAVLCWGCICLSVASLAPGQGTFAPVIMRTGSGQVLLTSTVPYNNTPGQPASDVLAFSFGFATQEQVQAGQFADSFTVSISGPGGTAYLVTADASGIVWAPAVPGAIGLAETAIQRQVAAFGVPSEGLPVVGSYQVDYSLPPAWQNSPLTINFDLFDNQDLQRSLAYFDLTPVPEPSSVAILLAGLVFWRLAKSSSPRSR